MLQRHSSRLFRRGRTAAVFCLLCAWLLLRTLARGFLLLQCQTCGSSCMRVKSETRLLDTANKLEKWQPVNPTLINAQQDFLPHSLHLPMDQLEDATFLNVSIADAKHFPDASVVDDLFSELATQDGCPLFECAELVKATGIDLMDCPLQLNLKLHVRRRLSEGAVLLWHMVLPLAVISKNLMQPPHEWDTWLGLLPANHSLETHAPEMMFTQAVIHLLAKPEYPKLRLQFKYHNPQLRAKMALQRQTEQERRQQQSLKAASYGQQRFQDLQSFGGLLEKRQLERPDEASVKFADCSDGPSDQVPALDAALPRTDMCGDALGADLQKVAARNDDNEELRLSRAFRACLELLSELQATVGIASDPLCVEHLSACDDPSQLVREHFRGLRERVTVDQQILADSLQYALLGTLDDFAGMGPPVSGLAQPTSQLLAVRERFPLIWPICRQVSKLANDRVRLMEDIEASVDAPNVVQENARLRTELVGEQERARKAEQELAHLQARVNELTLAMSRGQSPEIDLL